MKNSLEQFDFDLLDTESENEIMQSINENPNLQTTDSYEDLERMVEEEYEEYKRLEWHENLEKERQKAKYRRLKDNLEMAAKKFESDYKMKKMMNPSMEQEEDHEKKI